MKCLIKYFIFQLFQYNPINCSVPIKLSNDRRTSENMPVTRNTEQVLKMSINYYITLHATFLLDIIENVSINIIAIPYDHSIWELTLLENTKD